MTWQQGQYPFDRLLWKTRMLSAVLYLHSRSKGQWMRTSLAYPQILNSRPSRNVLSTLEVKHPSLTFDFLLRTYKWIKNRPVNSCIRCTLASCWTFNRLDYRLWSHNMIIINSWKKKDEWFAELSLLEILTTQMHIIFTIKRTIRLICLKLKQLSRKYNCVDTINSSGFKS